MKLSPHRVLLLSVLAALTTMALKTGAWALTGSVAYLSDAIESGVNLLAALFALLMVHWARQPADAGHPFGHGKAEYFSAAFEGGMIVLAAMAILLAAGERLLSPAELGELGAGTVLTVLASLVNLLVARLLFRVGRDNDSPALIADGKHLMTDVWTTAGVVLGLGLAWMTGAYWLDPVLAMLVALNILREGWHLVFHSVQGLMDTALEPDRIEALEKLLEPVAGEECRISNLRTRSAGHQSHAEVDLLVPGDWSVVRAHTLADRLEQEAEGMGVRLVTHVEPLRI